MHLTLEQLVPRLAEAGLFRKRYTTSTLAEQLAEG